MALVAGDGAALGDITRVLVESGGRVFLATPDARAIATTVAVHGHNYVDGSRGGIESAVAACARRFGRLDAAFCVVSLSPGDDGDDAWEAAHAVTSSLAAAAPGIPLALIVVDGLALAAPPDVDTVAVQSVAEAVAAALGTAGNSTRVIVVVGPSLP